MHKVPWQWWLFCEGSCKLLENQDVNPCQGTWGVRTALLVSRRKKSEGLVFKFCLPHLQGLLQIKFSSYPKGDVIYSRGRKVFKRQITS